jgi:hypothetical protein
MPDFRVATDFRICTPDLVIGQGVSIKKLWQPRGAELDEVGRAGTNGSKGLHGDELVAALINSTELLNVVGPGMPGDQII